MINIEQDSGTLLLEAREYLDLFFRESGKYEFVRKAEVEAEIKRTGTYRQTLEELTYGAKLAWRNNTHCIGRLHWRLLQVNDCRDLSTAEDIFQALVEHLSYAANGGKIRSAMTVFAPQIPGQSGIQIWNPQLIRYAGYRQPDGSCIGDPLNADLTDAIRELGWKGGAGTPFDLLPLVIQMPDEEPRMFELPRDVVLEVELHHPVFRWFAELGLKWHALPAVSDMRLEIGGISYTAAPFSGWYMGTEIGARNLGDVSRYNLLPVIASKMGLDTRSDRTLWKDEALIELNKAVLYSFDRAGIVIVDHHTACRQFMLHEKQEGQAGRPTPADWGWMVPPISGSATPVFHRPYEEFLLKPNIFYQRAVWKTESASGCPFSRKG